MLLRRYFRMVGERQKTTISFNCYGTRANRIKIQAINLLYWDSGHWSIKPDVSISGLTPAEA